MSKVFEDAIVAIERDTTKPKADRDEAVKCLRAVMKLDRNAQRAMRFETSNGPIEVRFPAVIDDDDLNDFDAVMKIWFGTMRRVSAKASDLQREQTTP